MIRPNFRYECKKLDPAEEKAFAEEGIVSDAEEWPEYRKAVLKKIQKDDIQNSDSFPDPGDLIREDRDR